MKRVETDKFKAPSTKARRRETRFRDDYHWTKPVDSRSTSTSGRERSVHEIKTVDRDRKQHHRSTSKDASSRSCTSSSSAGGGSGTRRSPKVTYTATKVSGLRYKFHSDKNGTIVEKPSDDEEDVKKYLKKIDTYAATDSSSSLSPPSKRKNEEPENFEEKKRQAVITKEIVELEVSSGTQESSIKCDLINPKESLGIQESSKDCDVVNRKEYPETQESSEKCDMINPPAIKLKKVDEPVVDDDDEEDLDILIIDLSDKERAEMESWAK